MAVMDKEMIKAVHITKKYGNKHILQDISFQVAGGERIAVVGKNGCGKTTLMQILSGILKPDSGELFYLGKNALEDNKVFRSICGYVPQEDPLMEELSVKDNLRLWSAAKGADYHDVISFFELESIMKMPVKKLSGGMKRRLSIACSLIGWPPVLLMDEPTTALDLYYKENIRRLMTAYQKRNGILLITTHDEAEIMECDRCFVIDKGNITELAKTEITLEKMKKAMGIITDVSSDI